MMGVVKEKPVAGARAGPVAPDRADELRVVPLVHEDQVRAVERRVEVERRGRVAEALDAGVERAEAVEGPRPVVLFQVDPAPRVLGLVDPHRVAPAGQLGRHAAQKVGVAVVPVREDRVVEHHDAHRVLLAHGLASRRTSA
jgi:hypothetical protein